MIKITRPKSNTKRRAAKAGLFLNPYTDSDGASVYRVSNLEGDVFFEGGLFDATLFLRSLNF